MLSSDIVTKINEDTLVCVDSHLLVELSKAGLGSVQHPFHFFLFNTFVAFFSFVYIERDRQGERGDGMQRMARAWTRTLAPVSRPPLSSTHCYPVSHWGVPNICVFYNDTEAHASPMG